LYVGKLNRQFLLDMDVGEHRLYHFPYSIDNEFFMQETKRLSSTRDRLCAAHGLDSQLPIFLFCGKLAPIKRPLELFRAYLEAGLKGRAQLIYVGDGAIREELERHIQQSQAENVNVLGFFNYTQLPAAYVLGQVLCLISDIDAWGLVVNEAMACGRPVLVSDAVGCAPDLVDATNGWVVPADDPAALAQALRQAYEERNTWQEKGQHSLKKISSHTYAVMADGVMAALDSLKLSSSAASKRDISRGTPPSA
jgi:glycosyltransferase involved in cell wall biosynthesis